MSDKHGALIDWLRQNAPDCGDNSCLFGGRGKGGMRTNGGCRCFRDVRPDMKRIFIERLWAAFSAPPAAWIEHHKGGDNLVWEQTRERCTPLYAAPQLGVLDPKVVAPRLEGDTRTSGTTTPAAAAAPVSSVEPLYDAEWVSEANKTLDRLGAFLQKFGDECHRVNWRDWIAECEKKWAAASATLTPTPVERAAHRVIAEGGPSLSHRDSYLVPADAWRALRDATASAIVTPEPPEVQIVRDIDSRLGGGWCASLAKHCRPESATADGTAEASRG